jgi:A/G-specific adenine glycosylase
VPVIDGNVIRVLSRLEAFAGNATASGGRRHLAQRAAQLLDAKRPGDSNQAAMELGATVCRPRRPDCGACPLREFCVTGPSGRAEEFPVGRPKRKTERSRRVAVVVERDSRMLLYRRPDTQAVLPGTWELPWVAGGEGEIESRLQRRYGGDWRLGPVAGEVRHAITYRSFRVEVRPAEVAGRTADNGELRSDWYQRSDLRRLPLSSLVTKAMALVSPLQDPHRSS